MPSVWQVWQLSVSVSMSWSDGPHGPSGPSGRGICGFPRQHLDDFLDAALRLSPQQGPDIGESEWTLASIHEDLFGCSTSIDIP